MKKVFLTKALTKIVLFWAAFLFFSCTNISSQIRGSWQLQEVLIPVNNFSEENYYNIYPEQIAITDHSFESWSDSRLIERMEYKVNNDSIMTLHGYGYQNMVIKEASKGKVLKLSTANSMYSLGQTVAVYVPLNDYNAPVKYTRTVSMRMPETNPIVKRLSNVEIKDAFNPAAIAYNFVSAIYNSESEKMLSFMTAEAKASFENSRVAAGYDNFDPFFSTPGNKLNIKGWSPAINTGNYEIAPLYVQDEGYDDNGRQCLKVYVGCVPSGELGYARFQDITRYGGTNVKVLIVRDKNQWRVIGFK